MITQTGPLFITCPLVNGEFSLRVEQDCLDVTISGLFQNCHFTFGRTFPSLKIDIKVLKQNPLIFFKKMMETFPYFLPFINFPEEEIQKINNGSSKLVKSDAIRDNPEFKTPKRERRGSNSEPRVRRASLTILREKKTHSTPELAKKTNSKEVSRPLSLNMEKLPESVSPSIEEPQNLSSRSDPEDLKNSPGETTLHKDIRHSRSPRGIFHIPKRKNSKSTSPRDDSKEVSKDFLGDVAKSTSPKKENASTSPSLNQEEVVAEIVEKSSPFAINGASKGVGYFTIDSNKDLAVRIDLVFQDWQCRLDKNFSNLEKTLFGYQQANFKNNPQLHFSNIVENKLLSDVFYPFLEAKTYPTPINDTLLPIYFKDVGFLPVIPEELHAILEQTDPFWPEKKIGEAQTLCLIYETLNGEPASLASLKKCIEHPQKGFEHLWMSINYHDHSNKHHENVAQVPYFALFTKEMIPKVGSDRLKVFSSEATKLWGPPNLLEMGFFLADQYINKKSLDSKYVLQCEDTITKNNIEVNMVIARGNLDRDIDIKAGTKEGYNQGFIGVRRFYIKALKPKK